MVGGHCSCYIVIMSNELFTTVDGVKTDAEFHDDILDNPDADAKLSRIAFERAIARGMLRAEAERLYGFYVPEQGHQNY